MGHYVLWVDNEYDDEKSKTSINIPNLEKNGKFENMQETIKKIIINQLRSYKPEIVFIN